MALKKREKILAGVTVALVAVFVGKWTLSGDGGTLGALRQERDDLLAEVEQKKAQVHRGRKAAAHLDAWQRRSLPSDRDIARSLYQNWLLELVDKVEFGHAKVESGEVRSHLGIYWRLPFTIRGQGTLDQLIRLLHAFYSAGHLHQIRRLSIKPDEDSKKLNLTISVEAISLPEADRRDKLSVEPSSHTDLLELPAYRKTIVERNLFGPYVPPPPPVVHTEPKEPPKPPEPQPPSFDHAKYTVVTAILEVGGLPQVWIQVRTTGKKFELREGGSFDVGTDRATVVRIGRREVEIEIDGRRRIVRLGESVRDGVEHSDDET